jgi:hypothetical protein
MSGRGPAFFDRPSGYLETVRRPTMRLAIFLLAFGVVGCHQPDTGTAPAAATTSATTPTRPLVDSGKPNFEEMLAALEENPADPKYKNQFMTIDMVVDEVKEQGKDSYLVTGTAGPARLKVTFLTPNNLNVNRQVPSLVAGDTVSFYGEMGRFEPGKPQPTITVFSGAINRVVRKKS